LLLPEGGRDLSATALIGAVIVEQDEATMTWKRKCDMCAWIDEDSSQTPLPVPGQSLSSTFTCPVCKYKQPVKIYRD
jgi:hypothetical protein